MLLLESKGEEVLRLMMRANSLRETDIITYSKNVFLPLTNICRNECGYCTFRRNPEDDDATLVMPPQEVMKPFTRPTSTVAGKLFYLWRTSRHNP